MSDFQPFHTPTLDFLDVTYHPDDSPADLITDFTVAHGLLLEDGHTDAVSMYRFPVISPDGSAPTLEYGTLRVETKHRVLRVSASGDFLASLRARGLYDQYFTLLASAPYRVTRMDAALDRQVDAAAVLSQLDAKYPYDVSLSRQRPLRTKMITARRLDGARSGTWYAGHRSEARVTARVYDKSLQLFDVRGLVSPAAYTRYELTLKRGIASLNDAYSPSAIFWAHIDALLPLPQPCPEWTPSDVPAWLPTPIEVLPYEALLRRITKSAELDMIKHIAEMLGPEWQNTVMHMIAKKMEIDVSGQYFGQRTG